MLERLSVDIIKDAYEKTGILPIRGSFSMLEPDGTLRCCGVGVIAKRRGADINEISTMAYRYGFTNGFDACPPGGRFLGTEEYNLGLEDGRAAWDAVQHLVK